jgi:hypothetical protein
MNGGLKLVTNVYWKPTYTGHYQQFKSNHPHDVKRGVLHSSISWVKVIYHVQKDINREINKI